jgi:hypothetical protein
VDNQILAWSKRKIVNSGPPIGAILLASFAVLWAGLGARSLGRSWALRLTAFSALLSLALINVAVRQLQAPTGKMTGQPMAYNPRAYWLSVAFEAIAIPVAVFVLRRTGRYRYILPAIGLVVGLHFFGLVPAFGSLEFAWIGGAICGLVLASVALLPPTATWKVAGSPLQVELWSVVVGLGCSAILSCSSLILLLPRS